MNVTSLSIKAEPADKPKVYFADLTLTTHQHITVYLTEGGAHVYALEAATLFALADAFLSAGQQMEAALEAKAAREVNEARAATDAEPFGTPRVVAS